MFISPLLQVNITKIDRQKAYSLNNARNPQFRALGDTYTPSFKQSFHQQFEKQISKHLATYGAKLKQLNHPKRMQYLQ